MLSMTGFGRGEASGACGTAIVQISSVNHRQCQVHVRSDLRDLGLEDEIRREVRDQVQRGAVTVQVQWVSAVDSSGIDEERLAAAYRQLAALASSLSAPAPSLIDAARFVSNDDRPVSESHGGSIQKLVRIALVDALAAHRQARAAEGKALHDHLERLRIELGELREQMQTIAAARVVTWHERFQDRVQDLLGSEHNLDAQAVAREVAVQADRIDVSEEMERLASHLTGYDALLVDGKEQQAVGKRLEFLVQELGREINTTGSKANDAELTKLVMAAKNILEQVREQAANVF